MLGRMAYGRSGDEAARPETAKDRAMSYKVAVVGATGNVGREMLNILAERRFPPRSRGAGLDAFGGHGGVLRRQDAEGQGAGLLRLLGHRHLPDERGRRDLQDLVAQDRQGRRHRDRQFQRLAHGPAGAADRARSQCRCARRRHPERHHRQSQLLDRAAGGGAEAAARCRRGSSGWWFRPINRCRAPARSRWTNCFARPARCSWPIRSRSRCSPSRSPST